MPISENEVIQIWKQQLQLHRSLLDSDGEPVEIIYPGRNNDSRGGDFRDAVINFNDVRKQGFIEIHTRVSGWQTHGHHKDPLYNQVILHVALEHDRPGKTRLQNGQEIPTIILKPSESIKTGFRSYKTGLPCQELILKRNSLAIGNYLDELGDQRFEERTGKYQLGLTASDAAQILYQGISEALGYSKNKQPFLDLARNTPIKLLQEISLASLVRKQRLTQVQALLLGTAGLLPSQREIVASIDPKADEIEKSWSIYRSSVNSRIQNWELFKVRPNNHPVRRIVALSQLLWRYRRNGFLLPLTSMIRRIPEKCAHLELESALIIEGEDYWRNHYDFNHPLQKSGVSLLGKERASVIIINILLPFTLAWSRIIGDFSLERKVRKLYMLYPRAGTNALENHMLYQLGLSRKLLNSARRQQGIIQIYKNLCTQGKCDECSFSK